MKNNNLYKALWLGLLMKVVNYLRSKSFQAILVLLQVIVIILKLAISSFALSWLLVLLPIMVYATIMILIFAWVGFKLTGSKINF